MKTVLLPPLEEVLAQRPEVLAVIKRRTKISTTAELILFTEYMLGSTPGLGFDIVSIVSTELARYDLALRDRDELIQDAIIRLWGSLKNAPTVVLNFVLIGKYLALYQHLVVIDQLTGYSSIGHMMEEAQFSLNNFSVYDSDDQLTKRFKMWGLQDDE